ncbi:MAG: class I SAM-dependent methyltransferase, partial [Nitrososphaeraceae archaeon]|nr:class I SAM-dependent methyltransferase [Nitrososphaeraceae archaeon]
MRTFEAVAMEMGMKWGRTIEVSGPMDYPMFYSLAMMYNPDVIFESGTNTGLSSVMWALSFQHRSKKGRVFTWDIQALPHRVNSFDHEIVYFIKPFEEGVGDIIKAYEYQKKLIFVDGDHSTEGAMKDFMAVESYLLEGDVLIFHDVRKKNTVTKAVDRIVSDYKYNIKRDYT